jgi:hypothetical protein
MISASDDECEKGVMRFTMVDLDGCNETGKIRQRCMKDKVEFNSRRLLFETGKISGSESNESKLGALSTKGDREASTHVSTSLCKPLTSQAYFEMW